MMSQNALTARVSLNVIHKLLHKANAADMLAYLCDLPALMVSSEQGHVCWVSSFQQHEQREGFKAVVAPVHKVTHENVVCAGHLAASGK